MAPKYLTVTQLTFAIKRLLEESISLEGVWIRGEISNFTAHTSGHLYFTLKDAQSRVSCVMFKSQTRWLACKPSDGMAVSIRGRIGVYEKSGQYQLYVEEMLPDGMGNLYQAFEALKVKLAAEGLFAAERKKKLPSLPQRIGLITSPTGAAVQDMIKILRRRRPNIDILIIPAQVQGAEAPASLVSALATAATFQGLDLVIIGRGGGSLEELWAFNDERVARAIAAFPLPIIAAVGHETDFTIADFVADMRAPTPSGAAEMAVPDQAIWQRELETLKNRMMKVLFRKIQLHRLEVDRLMRSRVFLAPRQRIQQGRHELDLLTERLIRPVRQDLVSKRENYLRLLGKLDTLSPLATLGRGYAIAQTGAGTFIKRADQVEVGELIKIRLSNGRLTCQVNDKEQT